MTPGTVWPGLRVATFYELTDILLATGGACFYLLGFVLPFGWNIPVVALALSGACVAAFSRKAGPADRFPMALPVLLFLIAAGIAIVASEDLGRNLRLSAPLIPAVLLFVLIAGHFDGTRHTRLLYITFSVVGLGLAGEVLWNAWQHGWAIPYDWQGWISDVHSPILVVPNDTVFLAVIAPLSVVLLFSETSVEVRVLAVISILLGICAVCVMQSRVAMMTMVASLTLAVLLLRPRLALPFGLVVAAATLLVDGALGFPLLAKFSQLWESGRLWDARLPIWSAAWAAFLSSPVLGHGLHTFAYTSVDSINTRWAHNLYLETLAEQGILGMIALGFLLYSALAAARHIRCVSDATTQVFGCGALAAVAGFCFAGFIELSFLRGWVVIVLFVLLGVISQLTSHKEELEVRV